MKFSFLFLLSCILLIIVTIVTGVNYEGYMNATEVVIYKDLNSFNTSNPNETIVFSDSGSDNSIGIYLPKNATIDSAHLNITATAGTGTSILTDVLDDSYTASAFPDNNYGSGGTILTNGDAGSTKYGIIKMNLIGLGDGLTFTNAKLYTHLFANAIDAGESFDLGVRHVYSYPDYNISDAEWTEGAVTWNNMPTTTTQYNTTSEQTVGFDDTSATGIFYQWNVINMLNKEYAEGDNNLSIMLFADNEAGGLGAGDTVDWTSDEGGSNRPYLNITYSGTPSNVKIDVNGTIFFSHSGVLDSYNKTEDFSSYLQDCLNDCTADSIGYCVCDVNITINGAGSIEISKLEINYTYDVSNQTEVFNWWNQTSNIFVNSNYGVAKFYNLLSPGGTEINITGFEVDSTTCSIDGTFKTVDTSLGRNFCNLTTVMSTFSWTNHTIYDGTLGTGSPANQTNATQTSSGTNQTIYFNVTGYYPNGTISLDTGDLKIENVTAEIYLTENNLFLNNSPKYGLSWYDGSSWLELNTSNKCLNTSNEDNYSLITIGSDIWRACYNDTNDNGEIDYFKVMIPHLSNQQFLAWHEEDNNAPTFTFTTPTGTYSSASNIPFNVTVSDNMGYGSCWYNVTTDTLVTEVPTTSISCSEFNGSFSVSSGTDDYIFTAIANDTADNEGTDTQLFSVSISTGVADSGGGGGSSQSSKTQNISIQAGYCGDGFCDDTIGEDPLSCSQDCVPDIFNFEKIFCTPFPNCGNWNRSWFINGTIFAILGGLVMLTSRTRKVKRLR